MNARSEKGRDDLIFAITNMYKFYSKPVPERYEINIWLKSFHKFKAESVLNALEQVPSECKYFPRPFDAVKILEGYRDSKHARYQPKEFVPAKKCDPKIAYAWSRFIRMHSGMNPVKVSPTGIVMTDKEVIEFCNKEAIKKRMPDAIPDKYKLFELWDAVHKPTVMGAMDMLL